MWLLKRPWVRCSKPHLDSSHRLFGWLSNGVPAGLWHYSHSQLFELDLRLELQIKKTLSACREMYCNPAISRNWSCNSVSLLFSASSLPGRTWHGVGPNVAETERSCNFSYECVMCIYRMANCGKWNLKWALGVVCWWLQFNWWVMWTTLNKATGWCRIRSSLSPRGILGLV